jgi:hypothetical protein
VGVPGAGVYWTESAPALHAGHQTGFALGVIVVVLIVAALVA